MVARNPDSFLGHHYLARLYREMGLVDKSAASYEAALDLRFDPRVAFSLARLYRQSKRYRKAEDVYRRILKENPVEEKARYLLADLYRNEGRTDQAMAELEDLRTYTGDIRASDLAMARILIDGKKYVRALALLKRSLKDNPAFSEAHSLIGAIYHEQGKDDQALAELKQVAPDAAVFEESIILSARILEQSDKVPAAIELLESYIREEDTARKVFFLYLSRLCRNSRRLDLAGSIMARGLRLFPDDPDMYFENGLLLDRKGDIEAAMKSMRRVVELDPMQAYALNYLAYTWVERGENLKKAAAYLKKAMKLKPDDGAIRDSYGWFLFKQGKYAQAVSELRRAVALSKKDSLVREHLGEALAKSGRKVEAVKAYRKAMALTADKARKLLLQKKIDALQAKP